MSHAEELVLGVWAVGLCGSQGVEGSVDPHTCRPFSVMNICTLQAGGAHFTCGAWKGGLALSFPPVYALLVNLLSLQVQFCSMKHTSSQA